MRIGWELIKEIAFWGCIVLLGVVIAVKCSEFREAVDNKKVRDCINLEIKTIKAFGKEGVRLPNEDCYDYEKRADKLINKGLEQQLIELRGEYEN